MIVCLRIVDWTIARRMAFNVWKFNGDAGDVDCDGLQPVKYAVSTAEDLSGRLHLR